MGNFGDFSSGNCNFCSSVIVPLLLMGNFGVLGNFGNVDSIFASVSSCALLFGNCNSCSLVIISLPLLSTGNIGVLDDLAYRSFALAQALEVCMHQSCADWFNPYNIVLSISVSTSMAVARSMVFNAWLPSMASFKIVTNCSPSLYSSPPLSPAL